ncbi:major facilitator superfamily transporter [Calycina marina]|uniref:Major facilitator superfamily transporter n=1 Tax=Calycina marina TaxID=1763456 RepID=A0A9P7YWE8_9HELO|nr:major facilitator superfamily transporter [Calycina marina]
MSANQPKDEKFPTPVDKENVESNASNALNDASEISENNDPTMEDQSKDSKSGEEVETAYASGLKLTMIVISLQLTNFCIAIDNTIIATAIPSITDHFQSLGDVGWYGSAYLLFVSGFQLFFGRLYSFLSMKWLFIACVFLFEIGSLISAVAPTSSALIVGRAISGFGASGVFTGALTTISMVVPLARRGLFIGFITAVYGVASIIGPLLGGVLTDKVSWRWCFYINLPLGGFTILILIFFLHPPKSPPRETKTWREYVIRFDPLGTILFAPSIICLLLALQWGGTTYKWSDGRIIALLVIFGVLLVGFAIVQPLMGDNATLNVKAVTSRHTVCAALYSFCVSASFFVMAYFIPIWFQVIRGSSAVQSGIDLLPYMISIIGSIMAGGWICNKTGYYHPLMFAPITLGAAGAGLIYTWDVDTSTSKLIGYQILYGVGVGLGLQQAIVAVQAGSNIDIASGIALLCFSENFGGAVFVSVSQNLWANKLAENLQNITGIDPAEVVSTGATEITSLTQDPDTLKAIRVAYRDSLSQAFLVALILICIATVGTLGVDWKNIKAKNEKKESDTETTQDVGESRDVETNEKTEVSGETVQVGKA